MHRLKIKNKGVGLKNLTLEACSMQDFRVGVESSECRISQANTKDWRSDSLFVLSLWLGHPIHFCAEARRVTPTSRVALLSTGARYNSSLPSLFLYPYPFPLKDYWKFEASSLKDWPKPSFIWLNTLAARSCISHPSFNSPALISMSFSRMLNRPDVVTTLSVGTKGKLVIACRKSWFPESCVYERNEVKQIKKTITWNWASPLHFLSQRKWRCSRWPLVQQWIPGHFQENPWSSSLTRHPVLVRHTQCTDPNKHQEASCGMHPNFWSSAAMVEKTIDQQTTPGETTFPLFRGAKFTAGKYHNVV